MIILDKYNMNDYKSNANLTILLSACKKMLKEKFDISLADDKIQTLLNDTINSIETEYATIDLKCNELNNMTLSKIKKMFTYNPLPKTNTNNILDDDTISMKLRELEAKRQIIPTYESLPNENEQIQQSISIQQVAPLQAVQPITFKLPENTSIKDRIYKTFIINSLNRDWIKNPSRNNIKFNVPMNLDNYEFYPDCVCFPSFVKNISPYVILNISDGTKKIYYTFIPIHSVSGNTKWDIWKPTDNVENIVLGHKHWSIKFYDFLNHELDLGLDDTNVIEVKKIVDTQYSTFSIKLQLLEHSFENNFNANDCVIIKCNNKAHYVSVQSYNNESRTMIIVDKKNELKPEDFINSKIMNTCNQFSFIIKYFYKLL
jgi:hypothetical protein